MDVKINFCDADGGEVRATRESDEIKDILSIVTREGSEINIYIGKDDFLHGYVSGVLYNINEEDETESLDVFISKDYVCTDERITNLKLEKIYKKLEEI